MKGWKLIQLFGDTTNISNDETVSSIQFDQEGEFLAIGDKGGRIVLFQRDNLKLPNYSFYCEFQSHQAEFDYLKSIDIDERIGNIKWLKKRNASRLFLSSNEKTIKLWKVSEQKVYSYKAFNTFDENGDKVKEEAIHDISVPEVNVKEIIKKSVPKKVFSHAHQYHVHSLCVNNDEETFLSSDDLRINLWNIENNSECWTVVDIKPKNMEDLNQVITSTQYHPFLSNEFIYSTSKGKICICDLRASGAHNFSSKVLQDKEGKKRQTIFSDIVCSITDIKYSNNGQYIFSRDYMNLNVWDIKMERKPVAVYPVHEYLENSLTDLYEKDCIFDRFDCSVNQTGEFVVTGSYGNIFKILNKTKSTQFSIDPSASSKEMIRMSECGNVNVSSLDFTNKVSLGTWHPEMNLVAVASGSNVYTLLKTE